MICAAAPCDVREGAALCCVQGLHEKGCAKRDAWASAGVPGISGWFFCVMRSGRSTGTPILGWKRI